MIKSFFISFVLGLAVIFIAHNIYETERSLDRCEQLVEQIHEAEAYLKVLQQIN